MACCCERTWDGLDRNRCLQRLAFLNPVAYLLKAATGFECWRSLLVLAAASPCVEILLSCTDMMASHSGLAWHTEEATLRQKFEEYGVIEEAVSLSQVTHVFPTRNNDDMPALARA